MKSADFDYVRAGTVAEAVTLLAASAGDGKIIAGGQSLVPLMVMRLARPALLVDITAIADLKGVRLDSDALVIGAATTQSEALADARIHAHLPLLAKALAHIGHIQTRNRGTIGGSLAHADPAAEIGVAALALDAVLSVRGKSGERRIAIKDFFRGPMMNAMDAADCLVEIRFPLAAGGARCGSGFQEVSIRRGDFALANAACRLDLAPDGSCASVALAIGGCGPAPLRLDEAVRRLIGVKPGAAEIAAAAAGVRDLVSPDGDSHVSADYRRRIAAVLAARAIDEAFREATP
jgi:CO/xanthine dehydrogenase FAD-binding subunit